MSFSKARYLIRLGQLAAARYRGISLEVIASEFGVSHRTTQRMTEPLLLDRDAGEKSNEERGLQTWRVARVMVRGHCGEPERAGPSGHTRATMVVSVDEQAVACAAKQTLTVSGMKDVGAEAVENFRALEAELAGAAPDSVEEARALAASVLDPASADAESAWGVMWNKPLFANARVGGASVWAERLRPWMEGAWRSWGHDSGQLMIEKTGKRARRSSFVVRGDAGEAILEATRIAPHRLFAIQGAATALRERAARFGAPYAGLVTMPVPEMVRRLQAEMGYGWGPITVLHFLTDLGLACKPDIHLARTARHLGLSGSDDEARGTPSLREALAINEAVRSLARTMYGTCTPQHLRYTDKVLMEISKQDILDRASIPQCLRRTTPS